MKTARLLLVYKDGREVIEGVTGYRETKGDRLEIFRGGKPPLYVPLETLTSYGYV
ncbi:MAG TPA: hypothetical protein PKV97_13520 [Thauera aminoaromatica]|nr:hypothetical protein [Thauera aminoaromatica]